MYRYCFLSELYIYININTIYFGKFRYAPMITSQIQFETLVWAYEGPSPKLAPSEGGSRGNIES